jgi:hypothetical protein
MAAHAAKTGPYKGLPASAFVYPPGTAKGGRTGHYPINTPARARAALAYAARRDTVGSQRTVAAKVRKRYPSIGR